MKNEINYVDMLFILLLSFCIGSVFVPSIYLEVDAVETMYLVKNGSVKYVGDGEYVYSTVLGERNTWDGSKYRPYVYDGGSRSVNFGGHKLSLYDWYAVFENDSQVLVDDMRWIVEYWRPQGGGEWRELDLWEHSFLDARQSYRRMSFGQRYTDGFSVMDVWYNITNNDMIKIMIDFIPYESKEYRFVWKFTGVDGNLVEGDKSLLFDDVIIGWSDGELNATYDWVVENKKCDIIFDSISLGGGERYILDPSVHPVMGADGDDDQYYLSSGSASHVTGSTLTDITMTGGGVDGYTAQWRFTLAIVQGATVTEANLSLYEVTDDWDYSDDMGIWRINEVNVGSLESDTLFPERSNTTRHDQDLCNAVDGEWVVVNVTDLVHEQVNLGSWSSGYAMAFRLWWISGHHSFHYKHEDYQHVNSNHAYMNVTYTVGGGNNVPSNDGAVCTNLDDTDNLYAVYREYIFTSNVSDADGYADIDYVELSSYSAGAYWTVRYDEDTNTFSEQLGGSYIVLGGSSNAVENGNDIDIEWYIEVDWSHGDLTNYDLRQYVVDDEPESDTDDYDVNYDYETRLDYSVAPSLSDGSGTLDRGDFNSIDSITASGTVIYYGSVDDNPASDEVDVWVICSDVAGGPWSDLTVVSGAFSMTVDSDDIVGQDTYTFKVVEEGGGSGGTDLYYTSSVTDTYIADRFDITITADDTTPENGVKVTFTLTVEYDYDDSSCTEYTVGITRDTVWWYSFTNANKSLFNDTNSDVSYDYTTISCIGETTHGITKFTSNTETVTWSFVNSVPVNHNAECTNLDDTDNLYAVYREYIFVTNGSDANGFADIDYIELSCYLAGVYWTVRYDEDTNVFSEEAGNSYIVLGGSSSAVESGDFINVTWYIEIDWSHSDLTNYDLRLYTVDDEPESDTDDYDVNYDYETRLDYSVAPSLSDGSGTLDRGDYDTLDSITASGTVIYYGSGDDYPATDEVDVWVICSDVVGGPWSDLTVVSGAFSMTVDSDDIVGQDTYTFKVVEEGAGSGGTDLYYTSSVTDTYIADRLMITFTADDLEVINGTQVNFTLIVVYDYDDTGYSGYTIGFGINSTWWHSFTNSNKSLFNDTDADVRNNYSVLSCDSETTHGITKYTANTQSVLWYSVEPEEPPNYGDEVVYVPWWFVICIVVGIPLGLIVYFVGTKGVMKVV